MASYSHPYIYDIALPDAEHASVRHLHHLLSQLSYYVSEFELAVALCDYASGVHSALIGRYTQEKEWTARLASIRAIQENVHAKWTGIAARDATMSIYHISHVLEGITFKDCETLRKLIDHNKLRLAKNLFDGAFFQAEEARHAVAHSAEMSKTPDDVEFNSMSGGYETDNIKIGKSVKLTLGGLLDGRKLTTTWADTHTGTSRVVTSECSQKSAEILLRIMNLVWDAFRPASEITRREAMSKLATARGRPQGQS
jgi:hypothetical protein